MKFLLVNLFILINIINGRIHHLKLVDDDRERITISTFGYLKKGYLQINVKQLSFDVNKRRINDNALRNSFTFLFEKTTNGGFSTFAESKNKQDYCSSLNKNYKNNQNKIDLNSTQFDQAKKSSLIIFNLDLNDKIIKIKRLGKNIDDLGISEIFHMKTELSNDIKSTSNIKSSSIDSSLSSKNETIVGNDNFTSSTVETLTTTIDDLFGHDEDNNEKISLFIDEDPDSKNIHFHFEIKVNSIEAEGLYLLQFYNCYRVLSNSETDLSQLRLNLTLELLEKNEDSYLSAGEMPVPILYLTWAIIYFLAGISWIYILKSSKGEVYKIHYLMLTLVFIKSISLTFHSINLHYIALNGRHETIWAILFYITYVLRGLLMIVSIILVGTGWTLIKHILSENERRLFVIVVPLQILAITAYIFLEEKEEGEAVYITWRQLFFLLDLLCCGAILFPVVWSIRHLEQASKTDGKAAINLKKLKLFKHFYIMVICYIYFTRIIGFLLKLIVPFRYEWLDKLCTELVTFLFFALTAYKFQPAVNNPYLQLSQDEYSLDNDYDAEMNEVANLEKNPTLSSRKKLIEFDEENEEEEV